MAQPYLATLDLSRFPFDLAPASKAAAARAAFWAEQPPAPAPSSRSSFVCPGACFLLRGRRASTRMQSKPASAFAACVYEDPQEEHRIWTLDLDAVDERLRSFALEEERAAGDCCDGSSSTDSDGEGRRA
jgi:hypothetical protein